LEIEVRVVSTNSTESPETLTTTSCVPTSSFISSSALCPTVKVTGEMTVRLKVAASAEIS
jgi:hypothetical protein